MRRQEPAPTHSAGRGKSLISIRTSQHQQRKAPSKSLLPRSYSSPPAQCEPDSSHIRHIKGFVMRSFSTPDPKNIDYRRNSDSFYRPKIHGSRTELDSDLENFEQFEECFIDIDADQDDRMMGSYSRSPEREEPKRVLTSLLPGSGIQRVTIRPISATHTLQGARDAMKKLQKDEKASRLNFRPLVVKMPARHVIQSDPEHDLGPGVEELQTSPQLEKESSDLERELDNAEEHLDRDVAIATEESDADTVSG